MTRNPPQMRNSKLMRKAVLALAAALLLVGTGAAYSRSQARPATLVVSNSPIKAFAQDGNQIAWASLDKHATCPWQVRIRLLGSKKQQLVTKPSGATCRSDSGFDIRPSQTPSLALAGKQALWTLRSEGNKTYIDLVTASYGGTKDVIREELVNGTDSGYGDHLGGISGDSSTLVYGVATVKVTGPPDCDLSGTPCKTAISGRGVERVTGTRKVAIPGAPPPVMLAASGHRIALVVAAKVVSGEKRVGPGSPATVKVMDSVSGRSVGSFSVLGEPLALAFAPSVVAVLKSRAGGTQIEFRTPAGALLRTVAVPAGATALSTTNTRAVFSVGKSIRTVRVAGGAVTNLVTAAATPIGLSIEGTRVAWAENVTVQHVLRGRIRAITVH